MFRRILMLLVAVLVLPLFGCGDGGGVPSKNADQDRPKTGDVRR